MFRRILIHALIISDMTGRFLVNVIRNDQLDEALLSGLISALNMFGEETLGDINEISISGLNVNLLVVNKYELICIAIMDADLPELNIREGCEHNLDIFYDIYGVKIKEWDGDLSTFIGFKEHLEDQIQDYFVDLKEHRIAQKEQKDKIIAETNGKPKVFSPQTIIASLEQELNRYQDIIITLKDKIIKLEEENKELKEKLQS